MKFAAMFALAALMPAALCAQTLFTDDFTQANGADSRWTSVSGDWVVTSGTYNATHPSNSPMAIALVNGLTFTNGTIEVVVHGTMDGALIARANGLATGGATGWERGIYFVFRSQDTYFHVAADNYVSGALSGVAISGSLPVDFKVSLTISDDLFVGRLTSLDGNTVYATTSLTDTTYASGAVGLYSNRDAGSYDNYVVSAVPEPAAYAALAGLGAITLAVLRRKR